MNAAPMAVGGRATQRVLALFVEPTPYILDLVRRILVRSPYPVDILFLGSNISQPWNLNSAEFGNTLLPEGRWRAAKMVSKLLSTGRYRVLHLSGWGHPVLFAAILFGWLYNVPVFLESDTPAPIATPMWKRILKRLVYPALFSIPRQFLPGGTRQARYFALYGVAASRMVIARMSVDVAHIAASSAHYRSTAARRQLRTEFGIASDHTVLVYVGRLEPHKGLDCLVEAFNALCETTDNVTLLIAGDGSLRDQMTAASIINPAIRCVGRLGPNEVIKAYSAADIAVVPSSFEPWGLVVNEAMACGLPVIASDQVGCVDDLVLAGKTGLIFRGGEKNQLRDSMISLVENREAREMMGKRARDLIAGWTIDHWAANIIATWSERELAQCA